MAKGFVYFLSAGACLYKIGMSTRQPTVRIAEYSPLLPFDTELAHVIECVNCELAEDVTHDTFQASHMRGEWYRISDEDIEAIKGGIMDFVGGIDYE